MDADKLETLTKQLGETGQQPPTRGYNTTEPARCAGEGVLTAIVIPQILTFHTSCIIGFITRIFSSAYAQIAHALAYDLDSLPASSHLWSAFC